MPTKFTSTRYCFGLLLMALALAACAKRTPAPAIALASPTAITGATRTAAPMVTRTLSPTPSPTPSLTPTPTANFATIVHAKVTYVPSRTLTPTLTRGTPTATFLPTSTFAPSLTPATPLGPEAYRLKEWTAEEALAAVAEADGMAATLFANLDSFYSDYFITIGRETVQRFPNETMAANLNWRLGFYETWSWGRTYSVRDFQSALEGSLNSGTLTLSELDNWLNQQQYYLRLETVYTTTNLFGDNRTAVVFQVGTYDEQSATFVLTGSKPGEYRIHSPYDQWYGTYHQGETITLTDLNGNGQPEIQRIMFVGWFGMAFSDLCTSQLALYEWRGSYPNGQFVDLARNIPEIRFQGTNIPDCVASWEFGPSDKNGSRSIIAATQQLVSTFDSRCAGYKFKSEYRWNGLVYEWASETANPIIDACTTKMAALSQIRSLHPTTTSELLDGLRRQGIAVRTITPVDLNNDGVEDWLALMATHNLIYVDLQAFIRVPTGLQIFPVQNNWYVSPDKSFAVSAKQLGENGAASIFSFAIEDNISVFQIVEFRGVFAAQPYSLNLFDPELHPHLANYVDLPLVEQSLFELRDTAKAMRQMQALLSRPSSRTAKALYLLGLTYELSGDEANAVQTYWQLWHDYPGNPYTFIARRKLVGVNG